VSRTIEDIQKDIELLGIKGGYDIEQLLTPQDCRRLSYEIKRLNNIINELEKDMIFDMNDYGKDLDIQTGNIYSEYHRGYCQNGKDYYDKLQELKGSEK